MFGCVLEGVLLFFFATFVFDCIHFALHAMGRSRSRVLAVVGGLHQAHHDFFDTRLRIRREMTAPNLVKHHVPELMTQLSVTAAAFLWLDPRAVLGAMAFELLVAGVAFSCKGQDPNHRPMARVRRARTFYVTPSYHAVHHTHPDTRFGSYTMLFDALAGTVVGLKGRVVASGEGMRALLEAQGARVVPLEPEALRGVDILVLMERDESIIDAFRTATADRQVAPEVWSFAPHDRRRRRDREITYRQAPRWMPARAAVFLFRRGLR